MGNKNDTPERKVVLTEDAQRFADTMNIQLFETSAKDNINVEEMFMAVTKLVLDSKLEMKQRQNNDSEGTVVLKKSNKGGKKRCCWSRRVRRFVLYIIGLYSVDNCAMDIFLL